MIHRTIARILVILAALLSATVPLAAQIVTPGNRVLVIDAGKTAPLKIQDTDGCKPTWTATSSNPDVATVTPDTASAGSGRLFKVKAAQNVFGATSTVTITLTGTGAACSQTTEVDVTVVVVRKGKHAEQMARKSASMNLKAARKARKAAEKDLVQQFNGLLAQTKQDLLDADSAEGPGQSKEEILRNAFVNGFIFQLAFLSAMMGDFSLYTTLVALDAYSAVLNYGFLPFLAVTLLVGGGGIWDGFVSNLIRFALLSVGKSFKFYRLFLGKLAVLAIASGVPLSFGFLPFQEALCFPPVCGPSGVATESTEAAEGSGSLNPVLKLQMLMMLSWTQFLGAPLGSLVVGGLANADDGEVSVSLQPAGGGSPIAGTASVTSSGVWYAEFGLFGPGSSLSPGKYMVEVSQNGTTLRQPVDVAAR